MPARLLLPLALAVVGLFAVLAAVAGCSRSDAQEVPATLYVSGMKIGGRSRAVVRLRNISTASNENFSLHYTIRATDAGQALSLPAAGLTGVSLRAGRTLELDLGEIVNAYRKTLGVGPYSGTVQFVAYGETINGVFGPGTVVVEASQTEGAARFQAAVEWR